MSVVRYKTVAYRKGQEMTTAELLRPLSPAEIKLLAAEEGERLGWFSPRQVWKKYRQGKTHYMPGDGSGVPSRHSYRLAIQQYQEAIGQAATIAKAVADVSRYERIVDVAEEIGADPDEMLAAHWTAEDRAAGKLATLAKLVDDYETEQAGRAQAGEIRPRTLADVQGRCGRLRSYGLDHPPTEQAIADVLTAARQSGKSARTLSKDMQTLRQAVQLGWRRRRIHELPRNLDDTAISVPLSDPVVWPLDVVRWILTQAHTSPRQRLYLLLAANCGYSGAEIGDIKIGEYDGQRITRHRHKTEGHTKTLMSHMLWPETIAEIDKWRNDSKKANDPLFLTANGLPLLRNTIKEDGKISRVNATELATKAFFQRADVKEHCQGGSYYTIRKTVATAIADITDKATAQTYLGHAAADVADKHYLGRSFDKLDTALTEIRNRIFG
jgi:integrase